MDRYGNKTNKNLIQNQAQVLKDKQAMKQKQMTTFAYDTYNRLSAELERAINYCSAKTGEGHLKKSFTQHLGQTTDDPTSMMMNIEGFLQSFEGYNLISKMDSTTVPTYPQEYLNDVMYWKSIMQRVKQRGTNDPQLQLVQDIVNLILNQFEKGIQMKKLPAELSERIFSQKQRDQICREKVQNGQSNILGMIKITQNMADETEKQFQKMEERGLDPKANKNAIFNLEKQYGEFQSLHDRQAQHNHQPSNWPQPYDYSVAAGINEGTKTKQPTYYDKYDEKKHNSLDKPKGIIGNSSPTYSNSNAQKDQFKKEVFSSGFKNQSDSHSQQKQTQKYPSQPSNYPYQEVNGVLKNQPKTTNTAANLPITKSYFPQKGRNHSQCPK